MKSGKAAKKAAYVGAGAGLILFAVFGLLPSSFVGGMLGLKIAGHIFGTPLSSEILPRIIVGLAMVLGVLISITVFVGAGTIAGWTIWNLTAALKAARPVRAYFTGRRKPKKAERHDAGKGPSD